MPISGPDAGLSTALSPELSRAHFIGIGGAGMSGLAKILKARSGQPAPHGFNACNECGRDRAHALQHDAQLSLCRLDLRGLVLLHLNT